MPRGSATPCARGVQAEAMQPQRRGELICKYRSGLAPATAAAALPERQRGRAEPAGRSPGAELRPSSVSEAVPEPAARRARGEGAPSGAVGAAAPLSKKLLTSAHGRCIIVYADGR